MPAAASAHRAVYKSPEVCEIADVQPYVLRSWEVEFPELGVSKTADGPRLYRKADVDLVLKIKHLLLEEGLTLAGARKQLIEDGVASEIPEVETITEADVDAVVDKQTLRSLHDVREGLGWILELLTGEERPAPMRARAGGRNGSARPSRSAKKPKTVRSSVKRKAGKPAKRKRR